MLFGLIKIDGSPRVCKLPSMDENQKSNIRAFLTARRAEQFAFLEKLVRLPSENPPGECGPVISFLCDRLKAMGLTARQLPDMTSGGVVNGKALTNLVIRHEFGPGPTIALIAHGDTAAVGPGWKHDPFSGEIVDGNMYGRGVVATKGVIAAYVYALLALKALPVAAAGAIELVITFDGETGGDLGSRWLLANRHIMPDVAIAAGTTHSLITASTGNLMLEVDIKGRTAPSSLPGSGVDTLEAAARVMLALYQQRLELNKQQSKTAGLGAPSLVITQVDGGAAGHRVADRTVMRIDRRLIPEEDIETVQRELIGLIGASVIQVPGAVCKVRRKNLTPPMLPGDHTSAVINTFQNHASEVLGHRLEIRGTRLDTDARHYANAGIPTVLYGVGSDDPHLARVGRADEVLALDDLRRSTELLARVLHDLLADNKTPSEL